MAAGKPLSQQSTNGLLKAMLVLSRTVDHVLESRAVEAASEPLSKAKVQTLCLLGERGAQTSTQIARFLGISKPAVTQIVDSLVRSRLVARARTPHDRRSIELKTTSKGRRVFQMIRAEQRHLIRSAIRHAPRDTAGRWIDTLQRITGALARADRAFQHFCLQCGAHADGTCVLVGGDANCPFLQHRGKIPKARRRKASTSERAARQAK